MSSSLSVLSVETRREAASLGIDVAGERRAEMAGHQARARAGAMLERRAPALARTDGLGAGEAVPLRVIDLQGVWPGAGSTLRFSSSWAAPSTIWVNPASTTGSTESRNEPALAGPVLGSLSSFR